jgi:Pyruvate/2-oxoacid:ferredoxin oxidoreductase delta subunit
MYQINTKGKQNDKEDEEKRRTRLKMTAVAQQELVACLQCLLNCPNAFPDVCHKVAQLQLDSYSDSCLVDFSNP